MSEVDNGTPAPADNAPPTPEPAPAAPPNPEPSTPSFMDSLPEEIRNDPSIQKFGGTENPGQEIAKSYINAQQLIGRDKIPMPVTEEDWTETYTRLGRPETPDDYQIKTPDGLHEKTVSAEDSKWLSELGHKIGLNNEQMQGLWEGMAEQASNHLTNEDTTLAANTEAMVETLKSDWGSNYDANVKISQAALVEFGSEDFFKMLDDTGLGNDPQLAKTFFEIGKSMMEDGKLKDLDSAGPSLVDIDASISKLMAHKAYGDVSHPEHKSIVAQVTELFRAKEGAHG
jgi:hypothetical protein